MARPRLGPTVPEGREPAPVQVVTSGNNVSIELDPEWVAGFVAPFQGRARIALEALLKGHTRGMAAVAAGVSARTLQRWAQEDPKLGEAIEAAQEAGFSRVYEAELYDRALDRSDRGSIRALELVAKSRSAAYRDKAQGRLDVVHHVGQQLRGHVGGWKDTDSSSESVDPGSD